MICSFTINMNKESKFDMLTGMVTKTTAQRVATAKTK